VVIMMVGLQGSGKTTSTAKLAKLLRKARQEGPDGLAGRQPSGGAGTAEGAGRAGRVATLPIIAGQQPVEIATARAESAKLQAVDVLLLDTAGRLHVDQQLMDEMKAVRGDLARRRKRCWWSIR
jgi:signal recognition particle subunit SRP54